jgi:hypothetical protein
MALKVIWLAPDENRAAVQRFWRNWIDPATKKVISTPDLRRARGFL